MPVLDIHHINIRTTDLDATVDFYTDVLGMEETPRPANIDFPGAWCNLGQTQVHILDFGDQVKGGGPDVGGGNVDHIGIMAHDFDAMKQTVIDRGIDWRQLNIPNAGMWQLFFHDPNGVLIELNFLTKNEPSGAAGPNEEQIYEPGTF